MTTNRSHVHSIASLTAFCLSLATFFLILSDPALAVVADSRPAGGAATKEIVIATAGALILTGLLLVLGIGHRSRRIGFLERRAATAERITGLPGWTALPAGIATASLLTALFGMYWDIALHIDVGRDVGPLANPAHYLILGGLFGIFSAGFVAMVLPRERTGASAVMLTRDWHAPMGGLLICAAGAFSLTGFPLDDMWHRLFGQDVTLWGPTHLMLIGGAVMALIGIAVLLVEGTRAVGGDPTGLRASALLLQVRRISLAGGLLIGMSTFQGEFDFGVPQFRFVFAPVLVMLAAGVALVATRLWLGRGAALGAVVFFLAVRGAMALLIGPVLSESTPHFALYLVEAGLVELVALAVPRERPLAFGLWAGALIGTVGLAAEWGWSYVWSPIPWPSSLFPEGALLAFATAIGASLVGAWIGARLSADSVPRTSSMRIAALAGAASIAVAAGYALYTPAHTGVRADVALSDVRPGPDRTVAATVRLHPADAADHAAWLTATAWQGDGLVVDRLRRIGAGVYRTTKPIPVYGDWKALIRLHSGRSLTALPVYLPEDTAIPAQGLAAPRRFTREFISDRKVLQREQKVSTPTVTAAAYSVVALIALSLLSLLAFGLHRLAVTAQVAPQPGPHPSRRTVRLRRRTTAALPG